MKINLAGIEYEIQRIKVEKEGKIDTDTFMAVTFLSGELEKQTLIIGDFKIGDDEDGQFLTFDANFYGYSEDVNLEMLNQHDNIINEIAYELVKLVYNNLENNEEKNENKSST